MAEVPAARPAAAAAAEALGEPDGASPALLVSRSTPLRAASPPPQHGHPAAAGGVRARDVSVRGPVLGKAGRPRPVPPRPSPRLFPSLPPTGGGGVGARWGPIPLPSVHGCGGSEGGRARRGAGRRRRRKRRPGAGEPLCLAEITHDDLMLYGTDLWSGSQILLWAAGKKTLGRQLDVQMDGGAVLSALNSRIAVGACEGNARLLKWLTKT
ncbi:LHFPL tetraspan subfamily member 2 protein isoform X2 [Patagioenas fasciata]|uniref:LHFPL tetraspan subfamily member 2 protein isoform X2 n=1 Tax=Patagioenas fasciata TaxID=372321 RepID=UPI003A99ABCE